MDKRRAIAIPPNSTFDTAHDPLRLVCDDGHEYIVKADHSTAHFVDHGYLNEFVCSYLLSTMDLPTPCIAIVDVDPRLVEVARLPRRYNPQLYTRPCFGSLVVRHAQDVISTDLAQTRVPLWVGSGLDLLSIGIFDLWVANRDRRPDHINLIRSLQYSRSGVYAIDHYQCFGDNAYDRLSASTSLPQDRSICSTRLLRRLCNGLAPEEREDLRRSFEDKALHAVSGLDSFLHDLSQGVDLSHINYQSLILFLQNTQRLKDVLLQALRILSR